MTDAPDASVKLRTVLDYLPCEACLAQPVRDQEVLCSICRRVDRQVGVRVAVRRTVLLERPGEPEPVVIPPPAPAAPAAEDVDVVLRVGDAPLPPPRPGVPQVVLEPLAAAAVAPVEDEPSWDDVASWEPADDPFEYVAPAPGPAPAPRVERAPPPEPVPEDAYVFQPPAAEPAPEPEREPLPAEDWMPAEEVPVVAEPSEWAPPEEAPPAAPAEPESTVVEAPPVEPETVEAEPIEATIVEDEPVTMEVVEDDAPPEGASNLWRLRGFDVAAESALREQGIAEIAHLAGQDAAALAARTGLSAERLLAWVHVADLNAEGGVPIDAAIALVTAGVAGPKGLRDADAQAVVERVHAFAGVDLAAQDVKRWKRRV